VCSSDLNASGQLGHGTTTERHTPVQVTAHGSARVIAVAAGHFHSLYVTDDGKLWAMGYNDDGQLGDGTTTERHTPVQVTAHGTARVIAVAAGEYHSLYVTGDEKLWAMGWNDHGQLGDGSTTDRHTPVQVDIPFAPGATTPTLTLTNLTGTDNGSQYGVRLANTEGTTCSNATTLPIQPAGAPPVTAVAAGNEHSLYVTGDGKLWAMGSNRFGRLGDGSTTYRRTPVQVTAHGAAPVIAVAAGDFHSLYVTADGKLWAMGDNFYGKLGDGTTTDRLTPVQVTAHGVAPVIAVTAGKWHSLYVTNDGKLWAMGNNSAGQLGDGSTTDRLTPVQVTAHGAAPVIAVAASEYHSLYATGNGKLWAMGANFRGQLGDGSTTDRHTPVQVTAHGAARVIAVAAGNWHSLYVTADGKLWAMGRNDHGQLSDGTTTDRHMPVPVTAHGAARVIAVAAGGLHSLHVTADGKLWAMGYNDDGQLGDGTTTNRHTPVPVTAHGAARVIAVAAGTLHSLYVTGDGKLRAMGYNDDGQLGDGTTTERHTPVQVHIPFAPVAAAVEARPRCPR
jgi:alpha-tubulin suppressor-like RCC1 family protein